ncbi:MAG: hypothetical protein K6357_04605 [Elusimicrobiota bacterium]
MIIIVCVKGIPEEENIKFDERGNLIRKKESFIINPPDNYALEHALMLKDLHNFNVITLTMGPLDLGEDLIRYTIAKGSDDGYILSSQSLKGADAYITSLMLSKAIKKIVADNSFMVFCGVKSNDGETGIVPAQIAERLSIPVIIGAKKARYENGKILASISSGNTITEYQASPNCLISFEISIETKIRVISLKNKIKSRSFIPKKLSLENIGVLDLNFDAMSESPTEVIKIDKNQKTTSRSTKEINIEDANEIKEIKKIIYE